MAACMNFIGYVGILQVMCITVIIINERSHFGMIPLKSILG